MIPMLYRLSYSAMRASLYHKDMVITRLAASRFSFCFA